MNGGIAPKKALTGKHGDEAAPPLPAYVSFSVAGFRLMVECPIKAGLEVPHALMSMECDDLPRCGAVEGKYRTAVAIRHSA